MVRDTFLSHLQHACIKNSVDTRKQNLHRVTHQKLRLFDERHGQSGFSQSNYFIGVDRVKIFAAFSALVEKPGGVGPPEPGGIGAWVACWRTPKALSAQGSP